MTYKFQVKLGNNIKSDWYKLTFVIESVLVKPQALTLQISASWAHEFSHLEEKEEKCCVTFTYVS